jgi:hypothetical protein
MSYRSVVLALNPSLYLRCNEPSGSSLADLSANNFTGTLNGVFTRNVPSATAALGVGFSLGGNASSTDYGQVPNQAALQNTGNFTYLCWLKYANLLPQSQVIMSAGQESGVAAGYEMYINAIGLLFVDAANVVALFRSSLAAPNDSVWHFIALTRVGNTYTFYLDGGTLAGGTQAVSGTVSTAIQATSRPFGIGVNYNSSGTRELPLTSGNNLDEIAVFPTGLSAAQVASIWAARNDADGGSGVKSPPGGFVSALAHERNIERKLQQGEQVPPSRHRARLDYRRKRGR